jgi:hypothetical protein
MDVRVEGPSGFVYALPVDFNGSGHDQSLGPFTGFRKSTFDDESIEPLLFRRQGRNSVRSGSRSAKSQPRVPLRWE